MLTLPSPHLLAIAAALALGAGAATGADTATTAVPATTIGVHPQDAKEALQKASPRADTGTLVRTSESAEKRARELGKDIQDETPNTRAAPAKVHNTTATPLPASAPAATTATAREPQRAASTPRPADVPGHKTTGTVTNTTTPNAAMGLTGTLPGADDTTGDATNTRDNAHKGQGTTTDGSRASGATDAMGNRTGASGTSGTSGKP